MESASNDTEFYYQDAELKLIRSLLPHLPHKTAVDVGAEKGDFVRFLLDSDVTSVYAFEPFPGNFSKLKERFSDDHRVTAFEIALGDSEGTADLHLAEDENGTSLDIYHTLRASGNSPTIRFNRSLSVRCCRLAALARDNILPKSVDLLKVDTEGYDFVILQNLGELRPLLIMCEFWFEVPHVFRDNTANVAEFAALLAPLGYSNFCLIRRNDGFETAVFNATELTSGDWGNIIFFHDEIFTHISRKVFDFCAIMSRKLVDRGKYFRYHATERQHIIDASQSIREVLHTVRRDVDQIRLMIGELVSVQRAPGEAEPNGREISRDVHQIRVMIGELVSVQRALGSTARRLKALILRSFRPRLWMLQQYPPRTIEIPPKYRSVDGCDTSLNISIVTPSFNYGSFIGRTVSSVLNQGYPRLEYIVQDNLSTDDTRAALARFGDRITVFAGKDKGQGDAINRGLARATGDILAYLNSDDLLLPGSLHYVADYFARHPDVDVVYGHRVIIDADDAEIGRWVLPPHSDRALHWADFVPQETLFWRRRLWEKVGCVDTSFEFALDWDLILRFQEAGARIVRVPRFLGAFRVHDSQKSTAQTAGVGLAEMARIRRRVLGRDPSAREIQRNLWPYYTHHLLCHYGYRLGWTRY